MKKMLSVWVLILILTTGCNARTIQTPVNTENTSANLGSQNLDENKDYGDNTAESSSERELQAETVPEQAYIPPSFDKCFEILMYPVLHDKPIDYHDGLIILERDGKYGYTDYEGMYITDLKYDVADLFVEGLAKVALNGKYGFIDKSGKEVVPLQYDDVSAFEDGYSIVKLDGKKGMIDYSGNFIIPIKYPYLWCISDDIAVTMDNNVYGFLNFKENIEIPYQYEYFTNMADDFCAFRLNGKYGVVDKYGKPITSFKYDWVLSFKNGLAPVEADGKWGYIDTEGKEILSLKYEEVIPSVSGYDIVCKDKKYGYMDTSGKVVIPPKYEIAANFRNGLAVVASGNKFGLIDENGKECIPLKYEWAGSLGDEGVITVKLNGKYGFVDRAGDEITPIIYDYTYGFNDGFAKVELNGKTGYINKKGEVVTPIEYGDPDGNKSHVTSNFFLKKDVGPTEIQIPILPNINFCAIKTDSALDNKYFITGFFDNDGKEIISPGFGNEIHEICFKKFYYMSISTPYYGKEAVFSFKFGDTYGLFKINDPVIPEPFCTELFDGTDDESRTFLSESLTIDKELYNKDKLFAAYKEILPQFISKSDHDPMNKINIFYKQRLKDEQEKIKKHMEKLKNEMEGQELFGPNYYLDNEFNVKVTMRYINVLNYSQEYFGYFHPQSWVNADVFYKVTGEKVSLSDLFNVKEEVYLTRLTDEIYKALRKESDYKNKYLINGTYEDERKKTYDLCKDSIHDGNFYLDEDGIVLLFDNYSIASYAAGPTWVKIPYACISEIVKI